jgi:hypothetical protein
MICQNQGRHGFYDGYGAGDNAWVVPPFAGDLGGVAFTVYSGLALHNGGYGFECHPELNRHAIADTALDAAGEVGDGFDIAVGVHEYIVMLGAAHFAAGKAGAELETVYGIDAQHSFA